jgi:hypothetical protein
MAIQLGSAYGKVGLDASGIKTGVDSGVKNLKNLTAVGLQVGDAMTKLGTGVRNAGLAMSLVVTVPIAAFFKSSVDSAISAESALADLNATIKSTGGAAGLTSDEIVKMAAALQKVTKFADDDIIRGQAMLLTFTKIGKDVFPQATEAMLNMAEKFGSLDEASVQLGKALNDPIQGVTALRRVGVQLTDAQEEQIKQFVAVNDIASAQKVILAELETEFGGLARAAGETTAGKIAQLTNAFDDLKEVVGNALIPLLLPLIAGLTKLVDQFIAMPPWMQKVAIVLLALVALAPLFLVFVGTMLSAIGSIITFASTLSTLGISFATIGTAISGVLLPALAAIGTALLPLLILLAGVIFYVGMLYLMWKTNFLGMRDNVTMFVKVVKALWAALTAFLRGDTDAAVEHIGEAFDAIRERLAKTFNFSLFMQNWTQFISWIRNALTQLRNYISTAFTNVNWGTVGKFILSGIANGMLLGLPSLITVAAKVAKAVLDQIKKSLGISSPSVEAMKLGAFTAQGFALGMQTMKPDDIARSLTKPITNNSSSQQQNITMNLANGLSLKQVRGMIEQNNDQLVNTMVNALGGG